MIKARSAFLSNYEVYTLLQDLDKQYLDQARAALAVKREEPSDDIYKGVPNYVRPEEPAENVRTVQLEVHCRNWT